MALALFLEIILDFDFSVWPINPLESQDLGLEVPERLLTCWQTHRVDSDVGYIGCAMNSASVGLFIH